MNKLKTNQNLTEKINKCIQDCSQIVPRCPCGACLANCENNICMQKCFNLHSDIQKNRDTSKLYNYNNCDVRCADFCKK